MTQASQVEASAAEWLAREDAGWRDGERDQLEAWLAQSIEHRVAYLRLKAAWKRADRLAVLRAPLPAPGNAVAEPLTVASEAKRSRTRLGLRTCLAAAAVVAVVAVVVPMLAAIDYRQFLSAEHHTQIGGRETVLLKDGSRIELNTDTEVRTSVGDSGRAVWLDRGEAYFEVAHDERLPFVVNAGRYRVTVLGTKFSVRRDGDDVQVKVVEGKVRVDSADAAEPRAVLTNSQVALTRQESVLTATRTSEDIRSELSWRQGMLVMNQWTLGQAAAEFNRYNRKKLVISESAAGIRLGGSFEADNVEAFSRLLHDAFDLKVETRSEEILVSNCPLQDCHQSFVLA